MSEQIPSSTDKHHHKKKKKNTNLDNSRPEISKPIETKFFNLGYDKKQEISKPNETKYLGSDHNEIKLIDLKTKPENVAIESIPPVLKQPQSRIQAQTNNILVSAAKPPIAPQQTISNLLQKNTPRRRLSSGSQYSISTKLTEIIPYDIARRNYLRETQGVEINLSFQLACESFKKRLLKLLIVAINVIIQTGDSTHISSSYLKKNYVGLGNQEYSGTIIQYGFFQKCEWLCLGMNHNCPTGHDYTKRDQKTWEKQGIQQPFKELQKQLTHYGYYLQDFTDNQELGHVIILGPYPMTHKRPLWHGLNEIPY